MITTLEVVSTRLGVKPKEAKRFVKFLIVGAIGFVVDFGFFNLLLNPVNGWVMPGQWLYTLLAGMGFGDYFITHLGPSIASAISFVAAVVSNFLWNRYWTYPGINCHKEAVANLYSSRFSFDHRAIICWRKA